VLANVQVYDTVPITVYARERPFLISAHSPVQLMASQRLKRRNTKDVRSDRRTVLLPRLRHCLGNADDTGHVERLSEFRTTEHPRMSTSTNRAYRRCFQMNPEYRLIDRWLSLTGQQGIRGSSLACRPTHSAHATVQTALVVDMTPSRSGQLNSMLCSDNFRTEETKKSWAAAAANLLHRL
jgi:hypothetical protein